MAAKRYLGATCSEFAASHAVLFVRTVLGLAAAALFLPSKAFISFVLNGANLSDSQRGLTPLSVSAVLESELPLFNLQF